MNAESSLSELSEIFVNENKKTLEEIKQQQEKLFLAFDKNKKDIEEIKQQQEKLFLDNALDLLFLNLINKIKIVINDLQIIISNLSNCYELKKMKKLLTFFLN